MFTPRELEKFFKEQMPATKQLIEDMWTEDSTEEFVAFIEEYMANTNISGFGHEYFKDLKYYALKYPHQYTNPWEIL